MAPRTRPPRGFTLVESMVALAVFTIGVLGVIRLNAVAAGQSAVAQREATASKIARDLAESFERLPWGHPRLSASTTPRTSADFTRLSNPDGLHTLDEELPSGRPLLGAAAPAAEADGAGLYEVAWRAAPQTGPDGLVEGVWIAVMVRYRIPATGNTRQLDVWTFKYNPAALTANQATARVQEI